MHRDRMKPYVGRDESILPRVIPATNVKVKPRLQLDSSSGSFFYSISPDEEDSDEDQGRNGRHDNDVSRDRGDSGEEQIANHCVAWG